MISCSATRCGRRPHPELRPRAVRRNRLLASLLLPTRAAVARGLMGNKRDQARRKRSDGGAAAADLAARSPAGDLPHSPKDDATAAKARGVGM